MLFLNLGPNCSTSPGQYLNSRNHPYKTLIPQFNFKKSHFSHPLYSPTSPWKITIINVDYSRLKCPAFAGVGVLAAAVVLSTPPPSEETLSNIPQNLSGNCDSSPNLIDCEEVKVKRIQKPKSRNAERCTSKCVTTCTRGGDEGPLNVRGPIVVFKQGFRSRQYW
ncbi:hypothetical protein RND81_01G137200 [Saponaria officinalis]|uniref:Uncharacterized protein n=1 Tax=Saponaria officinalis TaxID=3572 RepID=A0AAW1NIL7_SAPOF